MMTKIQKKFEDLYGVPLFKRGVWALHGAYLLFVINLMYSRWQVPFEDILFVAGIVLSAFYWKLFARMKKKEFESKKNS